MINYPKLAQVVALIAIKNSVNKQMIININYFSHKNLLTTHALVNLIR